MNNAIYLYLSVVGLITLLTAVFAFKTRIKELRMITIGCICGLALFLVIPFVDSLAAQRLIVYILVACLPYITFMSSYVAFRTIARGSQATSVMFAGIFKCCMMIALLLGSCYSFLYPLKISISHKDLQTFLIISIGILLINSSLVDRFGIKALDLLRQKETPVIG